MSSKFFVHVPATPFVEIDGPVIPVGGSVLVEGPTGHQSPVQIMGMGGRVFLAAGWPEFCQSNAICEGDILFCELGAELKMSVQICKQGTTTQMYECQNQPKDLNKSKHLAQIRHEQAVPNIRFSVKMIKTRLERGLSIPRKYAVHLPAVGNEVIITGPAGVQTPIKRRRDQSYLSCGWRKLKKHYDLQLGDVVNFEIVAEFLWKMEIRRVPKPLSVTKS